MTMNNKTTNMEAGTKAVHTTELHGSIQGKYAFHKGKTILVERFHKSPLKILKTFQFDDTGQLFVYMMDISPGMLDGDRYTINMVLDDGCQVYLTNQASTKIHPTPISGANLLQTFRIGENAVLEFFPEPLVPYAGSRYEGTTIFHLASGAVLLFADIITSGRVHHMENFQYESLSSRMEVYREDRLIGWDHFYLEPLTHRYTDIGALEQYTHIGTFWIFAENVDDTLLDAIRDQFEQFPNVLIGASLSAEQGITVRMLGSHVWELQAAIDSFWACCRKLLLGKAPVKIRK